jgi:hypothetical protein
MKICQKTNLQFPRNNSSIFFMNWLSMISLNQLPFFHVCFIHFSADCSKPVACFYIKKSFRNKLKVKTINSRNIHLVSFRVPRELFVIAISWKKEGFLLSVLWCLHYQFVLRCLIDCRFTWVESRMFRLVENIFWLSWWRRFF